MKITKPMRLFRAGLCALLLAGGLLGGAPVVAAEPPDPALKKEAEALLLGVAKQSRRVRQIVDAIAEIDGKLQQIDTAALAKASQDYDALKVQADQFDQEWRKKFAGPCGRDFRDEEKYRYWLNICKRQVARENAIEKKLAGKAKVYNKLLEERRGLEVRKAELEKNLAPEKNALDVVLLKLVANPLLMRCNRCLENIKSTLEVAECYLACWLSPG